MAADLRRRLRNTFDQADLDGNGLISKNEIGQLLKDLGAVADNEFDALFKGIDTNADGMISLEEFLAWIISDPSKSHGSIVAALDKFAEFSASGEFVKQNFEVRDLAEYEKRCFPNDDSWLQLRQKLRDEGKVFCDEVFRADDHSLYGGSDGDLGDRAAAFFRPKFKVESWERIWDLVSESDKNGPLLKGGASAHDIQQGQLGDCYFVSAIAAVAESPAFMARLVPGDQTINPEGIYSARFWRDGSWRVVVVDDYIPCRAGKKPIFAAATRGEFWVPIVEKAFAKLNGSYRAIKSGEQPIALHTLTGVLMPQSIKLRPYRNDSDVKQELFEMMQDCARTGSLLGCGSKGKWEMGIAPLHAYTILGLHTVSSSGKMENLVHVRNPWGHGTEWKGRFSDGDAAWQEVGETDTERLGMTTKKDGTWFMTFDDFCEHFFVAYLGRLAPAATHSLYHVVTETKAGRKKPTISVTPLSGGMVRVYYQGQDRRGLPDGASCPLLSLWSQKSQDGSLKGSPYSARSRSPEEEQFEVAKGESLLCKLGASSDSRLYATVICPQDSEVVIDHGDGTCPQEAFMPADEPGDLGDEDPDVAAMRRLVKKASDLTGWNSQDQRAVVIKLSAAGVTTPPAFAELCERNINDKLAKGSKFSKRTLRHLCKIAEGLQELRASIEQIASETGWPLEDQLLVLRKFVIVGVCSCEELADVILDRDINCLLRDNGQQAFGKSTRGALQAWATKWQEAE